LRGWSKQKILKILSKRHRSKKDLAYAEARRTVPALVSAAEAYFGSWGTALYAAGIDPNLYFVHHTWRKSASLGDSPSSLAFHKECSKSRRYEALERPKP
jgi:hypothetical protein